MRLIALVALRSSSRCGQLGQCDWWSLQIQGPGRQYIHDLHSMDNFIFTPADMPAFCASPKRGRSQGIYTTLRAC